MKFKFEKKVINVILNIIKDNQEYLTKPENLPQLAKLGYIYNTLWYSGRMCWGYHGLINEGSECEDNPKYKIEKCEPKTDEIENLIYSAWGMHVEDEDVIQNGWYDFYNLITNGKELSKFDLMLSKPDKTFDDWVDCLNNKEFKYHILYPNRKSVANNLLCTTGTDYEYKNGYIISDNDIESYGDWKNAKFNDNIKIIINNVLSIPEVKETIDTAYIKIKISVDNKKAEELEHDMKHFGMPYEDYIRNDKGKKVFDLVFGTNTANKYEPYYPINQYSIIKKIDINSHISYINAGLEICKDILNHISEEKECNIIFAKYFISSPMIRKQKLLEIKNF